MAPGLIAAQAMQTGVGETTYPVMGALKWHKSFFAQLATPLEPRDLANAMLGFALFRIGTYLRCLLPGDGAVRRLRQLVGAGARVAGDDADGMAFATWTFAFSATIRSEASFGLIFRLGLIPMFLFSGSFFPISNLGPVLGAVARFTPLWHGVNLTRMLCLDHVDVSTALVNLVVPARAAGRRLVGRRPQAGEAGGHVSAVSRPASPQRRPLRALEGTGLLVLRNYVVYRTQWKLFLTGFLEPVFYLFSIGIGVGKLIHSFDVDGHTIPYAEFVAPGMLAASAFNGALLDSTFNVFFKLKYENLYDQMLATPLTTARHRPRRDHLGSAARRRPTPWRSWS